MRERYRRFYLNSGFSLDEVAGLQLWLDPANRSYTDAAAEFTAANSEYLSSADTASLSVGDIDFWGSCWAYADSLGSTRVLMSKGNLNAYTTCAYNVEVTTAGTIIVYVGNGTSQGTNSGTPGAFTVGEWHHIFWWHDSVSNTLNHRLNGGATVSSSVSTGSYDEAFEFVLGKWANYAGGYWNGAIDDVSFGKSPVGGIAALATTIGNRLYYGGVGYSYEDLTAAEKTAWGLEAFWKLGEASGTRADSFGSNNLTDNATVTQRAGIASGRAQADQPVSNVLDRSNQARNFTQATLARRPLYKTAGINSRPTLYGDGTDDLLSTAAFGLSNSYLVMMVVSGTDTNAMLAEMSADASANDGFWIYEHSVEGNGEGARVNGTVANLYADAAASWILTGSQHLVELAVDGPNSTVTLLVDGTSVANTTGDPGSVASAVLNVFARSGATFASAMHLGEMTLHDPLPSTSQRSRMRAYFKRKWGTP